MPCDVISIEEAAAPALSVQGVSVPGSAAVGETFEIAISVQNTGDVEGSGTVVVTQDGTEITREPVTIPGNSMKGVYINHSIGTAGTYDICAQMA